MNNWPWIVVPILATSIDLLITIYICMHLPREERRARYWAIESFVVGVVIVWAAYAWVITA